MIALRTEAISPWKKHMNKNELGKTEKNSVLDALRVIAILGIVGVHVGVYYPISFNGVVSNGLFSVISKWGASGVQIFFVLSGYLAIYTYKNNGAINYYINRVIRIIPSYYLVLVISILFRYLIGYTDVDVMKVGWGRYFLGINMLLPSFNYDMWNNIYGFWTMGTFMCFYLIVPLIYKYVKNLNQAYLFFVISVVIKYVSKIVFTAAFKNYAFDKIDVLLGGGIFGSLFQFAIGVITFYSIKETQNRGGIQHYCLIR